ncbi:metal-dependent hydrolase [Winogradskyella sp. KYW1333]|jgi:L-ascorbate metabolism protein UlaG (beta-lactamase superfamily)|uniref:metal-dependent hydrolase n=1 Tax=unclassified Winogradskyella TaxID=2615021 RepID=UPI000DF2A79C|nr:metal-dependent hydrolase [Winogradskyella sp. KYW1333]MDA9885695.1 metal-dependent hydrolase [bacterium]RCT54344.1 metal-dependent hydrolase [Winogradskyella sp. KYW1333]
MKVTFYGHACLGIQIKDINILVDPFISGNEKALHIDIDTLKADYILVTHAHQDHTLDVEAIAKRTGAVIVSNYEIVVHYQNLGLKGHPMNHGGSWEFDFGKVKYVNAIHTSSFPDGKYGGQPGGFIIEGDKTIYIAGDTALTYDMRLIRKQFDLDLAVLPIGDNFTMGVDDAIQAARYVDCDKILGYHYDTFGYIEIDKPRARAKFDSKLKKLYLLEIGESLDV